MRVYLGVLFILLSSIKVSSQSLFDTIHKPVYRYKIQRIDSIESVYVIYAEKDGKFYKIASPKSDSNVGVPIQARSSYDLELISHLDVTRISGKLHIGGIRIGHTLIELEGGKVIWDLFYCKNLDGLYFTPPDQATNK
jgi:hypothetical protein